MFEISKQHPFYEEILQFYLLNVSTFAVGLVEEAQKDSMRFAGMANDLLNAIQFLQENRQCNVDPECRGVWELADFPPVVVWSDKQCVDSCRLHLDQELIEFARNGKLKPAKLRFEFKKSECLTDECDEDGFPNPPEGFEAIDKAVPTRLFETVLAYLMGGSYERYKQRFSSTYGAVNSWPVELQFFRHMRNGCFHKNEFRIFQHSGNDQIDAAAPPRWHSYVMPCDSAMNGKKAIGEDAFFHVVHLVKFLDDMSKFT